MSASKEHVVEIRYDDEQMREQVYLLSGTSVNYWSLDPAALTADDMASAVANIGYNHGQTTPFYSVGQFAIAISRIVPQREAIIALLFPVSECLFGAPSRCLNAHVVTPDRQLVPYDDVSGGLGRKVYHRFGVERGKPEQHQIVMQAAMRVGAALVRDGVMRSGLSDAEIAALANGLVIEPPRSPAWARRTWIEAVRAALEWHGKFGPIRTPDEIRKVFADEVGSLNFDLKHNPGVN